MEILKDKFYKEGFWIGYIHGILLGMLIVSVASLL